MSDVAICVLKERNNFFNTIMNGLTLILLLESRVHTITIGVTMILLKVDSRQRNRHRETELDTESGKQVYYCNVYQAVDTTKH